MQIDAEVDAARAGDPVALAEVLVRRAALRLRAGQFADAAGDLDEAAAIHQAGGRPVDEARCAHFAATCLRAAGRLDEAVERAERARAIGPEATPPRASAEAELGETRMMQRRWRDAEAAYRAALDHGRRAGLVPLVQAALQRRIAQACSFDGRPVDAAAAANEAVGLYEQVGRGADARAARVEAASALTEAGLAGPSAHALGEARSAALAADDQAVLADLALLDAARALAARRADEALGHARAARQHALDGDAPLPYLGAAATIAELLDAAGDRAGAYDSLAVGWVTLGDKLGAEAAAALFRPLLTAMRVRWGVAEFDRVKDAYYAARRRS